MHRNGSLKLHDVTIQLSNVTGRLSVVVTLCICILEVPASTLSRDTGYPQVFVVPAPPQSLQASPGAVLRLRNDRFLPNPLQSINHQSHYHCQC
jgi:hypothetical protein